MRNRNMNSLPMNRWPLIYSILLFALAFGLKPSSLGQDSGWVQEEGFSWKTLKPEGSSGKTIFTRMDPTTTGITFINELSEKLGAQNRVFYNGSGVVLGDVNGDGRPDIFLAGLENPSALYLNQGDWVFEEATSQFGLGALSGFNRGGCLVDLDGDRDLDLIVSTHDRGLLLFLNDSNQRFVESTVSSGLAGRYASTSVTVGDIDGNGTLDIYVTCYRPDDIRDMGEIRMTMREGRMEVPERYKGRLVITDGVIRELGEPDHLYLNNGKAQFKRVDALSGTFLNENGGPITDVPLDWGLSASFRDVNGDLRPDLYVCNDFWTPDRFWLNIGQGRFQEVSQDALRKTSASSMGVDFADLDRDGDLDFMVVDMLSRDPSWRKRQKPAELSRVPESSAASARPQVMRNTVYENLGSLQFRELAFYAGLEASDWSWNPLFMDVDLDGFDDVIITAGHFKDVQDMDINRVIAMDQTDRSSIRDPAQRKLKFVEDMAKHNRLYPDLKLPIIAFKNLGNWTFREMTDTWFESENAIRHGMATADLDGDGDLDLVVNQLNDIAGVYQNNVQTDRVLIQLSGREGNTSGIGARLILTGSDGKPQTREIMAGGRYLSSDEPIAVFACDNKVQGYTLDIHWPSGARNSEVPIQSGRAYRIPEPEMDIPRAQESNLNADQGGEREGQPLFALHTSLPGLTPIEFDEFARQPLLTRSLGHHGPGLAWADVNSDDLPDLVTGGYESGAPVVWQQSKEGEFTKVNARTYPSNAQGATASSVLAFQSPGKGESQIPDLIQGFSGYFNNPTRGFVLWEFKDGEFIEKQRVQEKGAGSAGPMALTYLGPENRPLLFCAGYVVPAKYPNGSVSTIYQWLNGVWTQHPAWSQQIRHTEPVQAAVWADLSGDRVPELILACEMGPIRVFMYNQGRWNEMTSTWGLASWKGFWRGITVADFDQNGFNDIVVANLGGNTPFEASPDQPFVLYYGTLFRPGIQDLIETLYQPFPKRAPMRSLDELVPSLPFFMQRVPSYTAYSEATVEDLLGERKVLARTAEVSTLRSTLFLNRGNRFVPLALPREAQLAPANGISSGDFNGDGHEDLLISQNETGIRPGLGPWDEGRGLVLLGDGFGNFKALSPLESGVNTAGSWKSSTVGDLNRDGRLDFVLGNEKGDVEVFINVKGRQGIALTIYESESNPVGEGVRVRLESENYTGPWKSIRVSTGFRSQDETVLILHPPLGKSPPGIEVIWNDNSRKSFPLSVPLKSSYRLTKENGLESP